LNWSLAKSLGKWGYEVHTAFSGHEALALLDKMQFSVILLDYQLPDLDGLQVARCIRKSQPKATVFLVTAFQLSELSVEPGLIDAYFNKPLDFKSLQQALVSVPRALRKAGKERVTPGASFGPFPPANPGALG
jgi:two-component system capsular synthesis sensor histidine kinase RcsC